MTGIPEAAYEDYEVYEDLDNLPLYAECDYCGTSTWIEDGFCGYCSEDFEV